VQANAMHARRRYGTIRDARAIHEFLFHTAFTTNPQGFNFGLETG